MKMVRKKNTAEDHWDNNGWCVNGIQEAGRAQTCHIPSLAICAKIPIVEGPESRQQTAAKQRSVRDKMLSTRSTTLYVVQRRGQLDPT